MINNGQNIYIYIPYTYELGRWGEMQTALHHWAKHSYIKNVGVRKNNQFLLWLICKSSHLRTWIALNSSAYLYIQCIREGMYKCKDYYACTSWGLLLCFWKDCRVGSKDCLVPVCMSQYIEYPCFSTVLSCSNSGRKDKVFVRDLLFNPTGFRRPLFAMIKTDLMKLL